MYEVRAGRKMSTLHLETVAINNDEAEMPLIADQENQDDFHSVKSLSQSGKISYIFIF